MKSFLSKYPAIIAIKPNNKPVIPSVLPKAKSKVNPESIAIINENLLSVNNPKNNIKIINILGLTPAIVNQEKNQIVKNIEI